MDIFIYQWIVEDEHDEKCSILMFGLNEKSETICFHVRGFRPFLILEIQNEKKKTEEKWIPYAKMIKGKLLEMWRNKEYEHVSFQIEEKQKLYFYEKTRKYPFIRVKFPSIEARKTFYYDIHNKSIYFQGMRLQMIVHEYEASPLLQMLCEYDLPSVGWVRCYEYEKEGEFSNHTSYRTKIQYLKKIEEKKTTILPEICIFSFDLEVYSSDPKRMPDAEKEQDVIFQIGCIVSQEKKKTEQILLTIGKIDTSYFRKKEKTTTEAYCFDSEKELLQGFYELVLLKNPHVLIGYNIFGFDIPYLLERAKLYNLYECYLSMGLKRKKYGRMQEIRWSSSAYSYQEIYYLHLYGRIFIDMLHVIKRDYKFSNYKLKTVSDELIGQTKDPLTAQDIFRAYLDWKSNPSIASTQLSECGKYCLQDSNLVHLIFKKLQTWIGLVEMAQLCNVPIVSLYTQGQQIKIFSQVYKKCFHEKILVQNYKSIQDKRYTTEGELEGAFVFDPKPGLYDWVIPFDFSSLYPTTIIAYNIDYSTIVLNESIPDKDCHIIEWKEKEKIYRYRFIKYPMGIIPSLLSSLLQERKETKKKLKQYGQNSLEYTVLDKRQLAYKVSANSMYGAMGVEKGYLPFLPGAMCTTAMGRQNIQLAADFVKKEYKGELIYGDSVTEETLLVVRNTKKGENTIEIVSIKNFWHRFLHIPYPQFKGPTKIQKEQTLYTNHYEIYSKHGWSPIQRVIRHKTNKKIFRIYSSSGMIRVTKDHSLILNTGEYRCPFEIDKKKELLLTSTILDDPSFSFYTKIDILTQKIIISEYGTIHFTCSCTEMEKLYLFFFFKKKYPRMVIHFDPIKKHMFFDIANKQNIVDGFIYDIIEEETKDGEEEIDVFDIETQDGTFQAGIGNVIVKNTDSIYCHFPSFHTAKELWDFSKCLEDKFTALFPSPMKLLFEEKLYRQFLILTKKRYMAYTCNRLGENDTKLTIRGVLLARRDNCHWVRDVYECVVRMIMQNEPFSTILYYISSRIIHLFQFRVTSPQSFIISKLLSKEYKSRPLPEDIKKRKQRLHQLFIDENDPTWKQQYENKSKPAHVQLALKLSKRGTPASVGSRIEFVILEHPEDPKAKIFDKIEDPLYFWKHRDFLRIDRYYYLLSLCKPLDQILQVAFQTKTAPVLSLYKLHLQHKKVLSSILSSQCPAPILFLSNDV